MDEWVETTTPIIQAAVREELKAFIEFITKDRWTEKGWRSGEEKLRRIQNGFHLVMDIKLRQISSNEEFRGKIPAPVILKTEIDLHGKTVNEAIPLVEKFIRDSYRAHERRVWIIHGKGTGVLREEVRQRLTNHPLVESFNSADQSHGEEGATQVDIIDWKVT
ncbi:Smr/MutS family protein [Chloroflexota bacterium]